MKKIIPTIILIVLLSFSNTTYAKETKSNENIQVSFTLSDSAESKDFITALNTVMEKKKAPVVKEKEDIFSIETFKKLLKSDVFKGLGSKLVKIIIILALAGFAKRLLKMAVKLAFNKLEDQKGTSIRKRKKLNTILPLINNVINIIFFVLVLLIVLSEIGIDITPLLAGAGIIGLAIGFGAQTLVKDFITGFFIILEGTISVGDYVNLSGLSGTVESLSIKSVTLRDPHGTVHTIPFSEVTTISNQTKDFSFHVFKIGVAYRENVDSVIEEIKKIGTEMYKDKELSKVLLGSKITIQGLNELADSAVIIKGKIKTKPGEQWWIGREFNRRIKNRFDELGIEIPFPHTTIYFGEENKKADKEKFSNKTTK